MVIYICIKFHENILYGIRKISKRHNSVKHVGGVTFLILCISFDSGLYLFKVS